MAARAAVVVGHAGRPRGPRDARAGGRPRSRSRPRGRPTRRASSGVIAPAEVLEGVLGRVPGGEDGRPEALDVTVGVAGDRPDVVGRHHAPAAVVEAAQRRARHRDATARRRTGGPASGGAPRRRRRASRRGSSPPGRSRSRRPGSRPARPCPRCRRQVVGQLGASRTVVSGRTGRAVGGGDARRPASRARWPVAASRTSRSRRPARPTRRPPAGTRGARRAGSSCRPAAPRPRR